MTRGAICAPAARSGSQRARRVVRRSAATAGLRDLGGARPGGRQRRRRHLRPGPPHPPHRTGQLRPPRRLGRQRDADHQRDGRVVAYVTSAPDVVPGDDNGRNDVVVHDRRTGRDELVQYATSGALGSADAFFPSLSADGRYVSFDTPAPLVPDIVVSKTRPVYLRDRRTRTTDLISRPTKYDYKSYADASPLIGDGGRIAFESSLYSLVPDDTNKAPDVFVYDRAARTTVRASTAADGTQADGPSVGASLSADGRQVAFTSTADNLVPGDTDGVADVFVKDLATGAVTRVSLGADGAQADGAQADGASTAASLDAHGRRAAFPSTATNLVPDDTDGVADVFVSRPR
ncbi:PD40 domain-containing protein [Streptomyces sp. SLBN-31]|uniref:TolB family protein n=1 Tax=Streptomyces sp. SLBN-31 TaxID=2768444 RepID=UPI001153194F|nr:PD40 domain-containing protein [Streptomyces sp. SLBN-31]